MQNANETMLRLIETLENLNAMLQQKIEQLNYKEETLIEECLYVGNALKDPNFKATYCFDYDWIVDHIHQATLDLEALINIENMRA